MGQQLRLAAWDSYKVRPDLFFDALASPFHFVITTCVHKSDYRKCKTKTASKQKAHTHRIPAQLASHHNSPARAESLQRITAPPTRAALYALHPCRITTPTPALRSKHCTHALLKADNELNPAVHLHIPALHPNRQQLQRLGVCENRDGWLVAWGSCG